MIGGDMLRISWPLAFLLAATIAIAARKPRMLPWMLIAYGVWFVVESARTKRKP
jgi:tellurite resistance protein TehA-like permease